MGCEDCNVGHPSLNQVCLVVLKFVAYNSSFFPQYTPLRLTLLGMVRGYNMMGT